jgi:hypothetical protein
MRTDVRLHHRPFGFFGKGNTFFHSDVTYTVTKVRPDWLVHGWGWSAWAVIQNLWCGRTRLRLIAVVNSITAHRIHCGRAVLQ